MLPVPWQRSAIPDVIVDSERDFRCRFMYVLEHLIGDLVLTRRIVEFSAADCCLQLKEVEGVVQSFDVSVRCYRCEVQ